MFDKEFLKFAVLMVAILAILAPLVYLVGCFTGAPGFTPPSADPHATDPSTIDTKGREHQGGLKNMPTE